MRCTRKARTRELRPLLEAIAGTGAEILRTQPLSVKVLLAKMLIEDFMALDRTAAHEWLQAVEWEHGPEAGDVEAWTAERLAAADKLFSAEIARRAAAEAKGT